MSIMARCLLAVCSLLELLESTYGVSRTFNTLQYFAPAMQPRKGISSARGGVVCGTRFWGRQESDLKKLEQFVSRAVVYADRVIVAVRVEEDQTNTMSFLNRLKCRYPTLEAIAVEPWTAFTPALNALLACAARLHAKYILYQSVEVRCASSHVQELRHRLDEGLLFMVAGAVLPGHVLTSASTLPLSALACPWNTLALWHVPTLAKTGFIAVSDGLYPEDASGGMEEVAVVAVHQLLRGAAQSTPTRCEALLVELPGVSWREPNSTSSAQRLADHRKKMRSKHSRASAQMKYLGLQNHEGVCHFIRTQHDS